MGYPLISTNLPESITFGISGLTLFLCVSIPLNVWDIFVYLSILKMFFSPSINTFEEDLIIFLLLNNAYGDLRISNLMISNINDLNFK